MKHPTSASEITGFLSRAKKLLSVGLYDFVPRGKNMQTLAKHGMTIKDAKNEIFDLTVSDYYKGPKKDFDRDHTGDIWEFKKDINGAPFYVKLKITKENNIQILKCLSFHEDDYA